MPPKYQVSRHAFPAFVRAAFFIRFHVPVAAMVLLAFGVCHAEQSVTLAWDPNPEPNIARYKIYYGTESGDPDQSFDAGNVTSTTVVDLADETTYFFTVTAINTDNLESPPSNEVSYRTPGTPGELYQLTVNSGTGSGAYPYAEEVPVSANPPGPGEQFERWDGDRDILANFMSSATTARIIRMEDLTITAIYSYTVTVTNGTGDGSYLAGDKVQIVADSAAAGQQFTGWIANQNVVFSSASSPSTSFTMPASVVTVTATYSAIPKYTLTVSNGTGSGSYTAGTAVTVTANAAPAGQQFAGWTGNVSFADAKSPTTTLTMPSYAVTVTATYKVSDSIRYYPRSGFRSRMVGGIFEGTNDPANGYTYIYMITSTPPLAWTAVNVNLANYRYLRYRAPNGSYGNVAEIEFYRGGAKLTGTGYGTPGSWRNRGNTFQKALDNNIATHFDAPTANGNYVGIITQ